MRKYLLSLIHMVVPLTLLAADNDLVREKLDLVLEELESPTPLNWEIPDFLINFFRFFAGLGLLYRIIFLLCVIALVIFILYKLITLLVKDLIFLRPQQKPGPENREAFLKGQTDFLQRARAFYEEGNYSRAVLELHKGSYEYLYYTKILEKGRDYTNREIFRRLKNSTKLNPFKEIALTSEMIVFRGDQSDSLRYTHLEEQFTEAFYAAE